MHLAHEMPAPPSESQRPLFGEQSSDLFNFSLLFLNLAKEQELDISKWYLILQDGRDSHRPHAGMGPSPRAFLIWIFEKKAQRNKIFVYLKVMGTSRRTKLYISKRYIWTQRSCRFSTGMGPQARNLFESLKYNQFFLWLWWVCLEFYFIF